MSSRSIYSDLHHRVLIWLSLLIGVIKVFQGRPLQTHNAFRSDVINALVGLLSIDNIAALDIVLSQKLVNAHFKFSIRLLLNRVSCEILAQFRAPGNSRNLVDAVLISKAVHIHVINFVTLVMFLVLRIHQAVLVLQSLT